MSWLFYLVLVVMLIAAIIHHSVAKRPRPPGRGADIWLMHFLFWGVGIMGILSGIVLLSEAVYPQHFQGSFIKEFYPFQYEAALSAISIGVIGVIATWIRGGFRMATVIVSALFAFGEAAIVFSVSDSIFAFVMAAIIDIAFPVILILLLITHRVRAGKEAFWRS